MRDTPSHYRLLYGAKQIQERIESLGEEITVWAHSVQVETGKPVVVVPLMRGALFFAADLMRAIRVPVELMPLRVAHYNPEKNMRSAELLITPDEDFDVQGRTLLVVDDIFDSGITLAGVCIQLVKRGSVETKSVVAIHRMIEGAKGKPTWSAFQFSGKEWLVGYGMDDKNLFRNLDGIYCMEGSGG